MKAVSRGRATVLSLDPEDLTNPPGIEAAFREIVSLLSHKHIVVDMTGVTRLTSMGVSALSTGAELARRAEGRLALAGVRPEVLSLLKKADGMRLMDVAEDVESALRGLAAHDEAAEEGE